MNNVIKALPGIWTPWAQVLCYPCHGISGPVTSTDLPEREGVAGSDTEWGESRCKCDDCGSPIWIRSDAGALALLRDLCSADTESPVSAALWQTGGMCSALCIRNSKPGPMVIVSALDGPYCLGLYASDEAWDDGDYGDMVDLDEDAPLQDVLTAALDLLNSPATEEN